MAATFDGEAVRAGQQARERFYDSRGYGRPVEGGDLVLAPVEAAHLLFRGDLDAVVDERPDGAGEGTRADGTTLDFRAFLATSAVSEVAFQVYTDLRDRGFYLAPEGRESTRGETNAGEVNTDGENAGDVNTWGTTFEVYPRGSGPWDDEVAYRVRPLSERASVSTSDLLDLAAGEEGEEGEEGQEGEDVEAAAPTGEGVPTGVLAVVDEESELTYLEVARPTLSGSTFHQVPEGIAGELLADRVLVPDAPPVLHDRAFYGQRMDRDADLLQLSLVEAAYLAGQGALDVDGDQDALVERGRDVEGERFDRRLRAYSALRSAGVVPKTGFKFGADFRTYADVESVEELGHSELLVRVLEPDHEFSPIDLALYVRLAHGVRKRMVYALTGRDEGIVWLRVGRLTP